VLDEDELEDLELSDELRENALKGLKDVQSLFESKNPPQ
jgi:hypothetical protein